MAYLKNPMYMGSLIPGSTGHCLIWKMFETLCHGILNKVGLFLKDPPSSV